MPNLADSSQPNTEASQRRPRQISQHIPEQMSTEIPINKVLQRCAGGCASIERLSLCAGCRSVRYCGKACQKAHWSDHSTDCKRLQVQKDLAIECGMTLRVQKHLNDFINLHHRGLLHGVADELGVFVNPKHAENRVLTFRLEYTPKEMRKFRIVDYWTASKAFLKGVDWKQLGVPVSAEVLCTVTIGFALGDLNECPTELTVMQFLKEQDSSFAKPLAELTQSINDGFVFLGQQEGKLIKSELGTKVSSALRGKLFAVPINAGGFV